MSKNTTTSERLQKTYEFKKNAKYALITENEFKLFENLLDLVHSSTALGLDYRHLDQNLFRVEFKHMCDNEANYVKGFLDGTRKILQKTGKVDE